MAARWGRLVNGVGDGGMVRFAVTRKGVGILYVCGGRYLFSGWQSIHQPTI